MSDNSNAIQALTGAVPPDVFAEIEKLKALEEKHHTAHTYPVAFASDAEKVKINPFRDTRANGVEFRIAGKHIVLGPPPGALSQYVDGMLSDKKFNDDLLRGKALVEATALAYVRRLDGQEITTPNNAITRNKLEQDLGVEAFDAVVTMYSETWPAFSKEALSDVKKF
jgi:hypothetical protein